MHADLATTHADHDRADLRAALQSIQADVDAVLAAARALFVSVRRGDVERVVRELLPTPAGTVTVSAWEDASALLRAAADECLASGPIEGRHMFLQMFPERQD